MPGWETVDDGRAFRRTFELPNFRAALAFVTYGVEIAKAMDHGPGIQLKDNTVTLTPDHPYRRWLDGEGFVPRSEDPHVT